MKARIKGTKEIVEVLGLGVNGKYLQCKLNNGEIDMLPPDSLVEINERTFDWESFRAEAAKDILCAMINHFGTKDNLEDIKFSILCADMLIAKLKEKEA